MSILIASQLRMRSTALSIWFKGCCPCQTLTGVGVTCKEMLLVLLRVSWTESYIEFWNLPGCFIFLYDQICISDTCYILICYKTTMMMMMKCKHHESHITFGIAPNGQTQK